MAIFWLMAVCYGIALIIVSMFVHSLIDIRGIASMVVECLLSAYVGFGIGTVWHQLQAAKRRGDQMPPWRHMLWMVPFAVLGWPRSFWIMVTRPDRML
jgi:hypothetical protein